jgi:hypothetical protein
LPCTYSPGIEVPDAKEKSMATITTDFINGASIAAIAAERAKDVKWDAKSVPTLGAEPSEAEIKKWNDAIRRKVAETGDAAVRSDRYAHEAFVMTTLASTLNEASWYEGQLKDAQVGIPVNKDALTLAFAYHLDLDVGHATNGKNHSKALNRYYCAGRQLLSLYRNEDGSLALPFNPVGVLKLVERVEIWGGIAKLEQEYRKTKRNDDDTTLVALDADKLAKLRLDGLADRLAGGEELVVAWGERSDGSVVVREELKLTPAVKNALAAQFATIEPKVRLLKELFEVGRCVPELKTNIPRDKFDDPNDKKTVMRRTRRHFAFNPDNSVTISQVLSAAGVIVRANPRVELLDRPVLGHVEFRTQQCPKVEANLADGRADAFHISYEDAPEAKTLELRIKLTSSAADPKDEIKLPVQYSHSDAGNLPLALDDFEPMQTFEKVSGLLPTIQEITPACKAADKTKTPIAVTASAGDISFSVRTLSRSIKHGGATRNISVDVHPVDFEAVTLALANVVPLDGISLGIDPSMLVFSFETASGAYKVFLPAVSGGDIARSSRRMGLLVPTAWPSTATGSSDA